eukprot:3519362-Rhodomonas_salina.3
MSLDGDTVEEAANNLFTEIVESFKQRRVLEAWRLCNHLKRNHWDKYQHEISFLNRVQEAHETFKNATGSLQIRPEMEIVAQSTTGVFTYRSHHHNCECKNGMRLVSDTILYAPLLYMLTIVRDVGLYKQWIPFVQDSCLLSNHNDDWGKVDFWCHFLPPFSLGYSPRDVCLSFQVFDCLDEEKPCVVLVGKDMRNPTVTVKMRDKKTERMAFCQYVIRLCPISPKSVHVTIATCTCPTLKFTPRPVEEWVAQQLMSDFLSEWGDLASHVARLRMQREGKNHPHVRSLEQDAKFIQFMERRLSTTIK